MAPVETEGELAPITRLAMTYHGPDPALLEEILPSVDFLEITPDTLVGHDGRLRADALAELKAASADVGLIVHGIGLSLCSHDEWWEPYLHILDVVANQLPLAWHSEHLGFTRVNGEFLGTMLPAPNSDEMLDLLVPRIDRIQQRYGLPFLVENVVQMLPPYPQQHSDAAFLNSLTSATECGLLLDVYNLRCDETNNNLNVGAFLDQLALDRVWEIHVAGGVQRNGVMLDVHSRPPANETLHLAEQVLAQAPQARALTLELLDEAVPVWGTDRLMAELHRVGRCLQGRDTCLRLSSPTCN
jgi:uncharacterized protein (UPF0276 family)